jgi:hypothetical protein
LSTPGAARDGSPKNAVAAFSRSSLQPLANRGMNRSAGGGTREAIWS